MDIASQEYTPPDHALRVLVRIDTRQGLACLEVRGCLTPDTCSTLLNILAHTGGLGAAVSVNLLRAAHVDSGALALILDSADDAVHADPDRASSAPVEILVPPVLPVCQSGPVSPAAAAAPAAPDLPVQPPLPGTPVPGLSGSGLSGSGLSGSGVSTPERPLPGGPLSPHPLTNEEAVELAFVLRDPRVFTQPSPFRPQVL
ncbi:hypothetical protein KKR91_00685 [Arthrobacter jiangjiafuii]|uniref:Uncharacterized protein n=1 Tax=Arthrobacter jiangjiafuii TaxID=2817475 RepID=A0A975M692_9MICC|nr:hypothetical protein [Arthrobacter jiangjiafuii]MBP3041998.1 hypothetical protein [Arthrobacter jiangjiafuii]QWC10211.1 hypothetical protein KKR91_00685 [Arthrobacter jiangjiafuii]